MGFMDPGNVVWFEISTSDAEPAQKFYAELLGWKYEIDPDSSIEGRRYIRVIAPGAPFPMGAIQQAPGSPQRMNLSIVSADVAADVRRLEKLGAAVQVPATQVSDVTWFAVLTDPRGNPFSLFSRSQSERFAERMEQGEKAMSEAAFAPTPGAMGWFELGTADRESTEKFYSAAFGWKFVLDDTAGGKPYYNIFITGEHPSGGLSDQGRDGADYLMPSFLVSDVAATTAAAEKLGATLAAPQDADPDGLVYSYPVDPFGNRFGLFSLPTATRSLAPPSSQSSRNRLTPKA
ncbi:VOC family protein [Nocardia sp. NPDC048505]|uniref:VOC family protein n=1 Tax=unclassified Nocardia TaxID=2637762 RepID=UPI0033CC1CF6